MKNTQEIYLKLMFLTRSDKIISKIFKVLHISMKFVVGGYILVFPFTLVFGVMIMLYTYIKRNMTGCSKYKDRLSIVAIAKNEAEYIEEWVVFHKVVGVDKIYLYDNDSNDNMKEILLPYMESGFVIYNEIHGVKWQYDAYNDALERYGNDTQYMAFIDCDEFLIPGVFGQSIADMVESVLDKNCNAGGLAVNWCMYGSSGHTKKPEGLLIENFMWRENISKRAANSCIKTIVKPGCTKYFKHPHFPVYRIGYYGINSSGKIVLGAYNNLIDYSILRINHYFTKSMEQWIKRRAIGMADRDDARSIQEFYDHDNNDVYDECVVPYINLLKRELEHK